MGPICSNNKLFVHESILEAEGAKLSYASEEKLRVAFIMPRTGEWASGGFRVIYEYANRLAARGHQVTVVHPGRYVINPTALDRVKNLVRYSLRKLDGRYTPAPWLAMDSRVRLTCVPNLSHHFVPDGDVVIATAWQTAEWVAQYPPAKGTGFYLIQHLETWNGPSDRVYATWTLPLRKIVPSRWLLNIAESLGETAVYIPNGIDTDAFHRLVPMHQRNPCQVMMLYHKAEWKGTEEGLQALRLIKEKKSEVKAILFGVPEAPEGLPEWIEYHRSPSKKSLLELYNRASVFLSPSRTEGWGLTGCEALLCGAALATTDIDGHREYAIDGETALTSPARDPEKLAENVLKLIDDPNLRTRLADNGRVYVEQFSWQRASRKFEETLAGAVLHLPVDANARPEYDTLRHG